MDFVTIMYWACLIFGGVFVFVLGLLGHIGGGHDLDVGGHDLDVGHDVGGHGEVGDISFISPFIIAIFLVMFGATGLACESLTIPSLLGLPLSAGVAIGFAVLAFVVLAKLSAATQWSSHIKLADLEGLEATVITPIPADGVGEVAYIAGDARRNSRARSSDGDAIDKHSTVRIDKVVGSTVLVHQAVDERLRNLRPDEDA